MPDHKITSTTPSEREPSRQIEHIVQTIVRAVNSRDFSATQSSPITWTNYLALEISTSLSLYSTAQTTSQTLPEFLSTLKAITSLHPRHHISILDVNVYVGDGTDYAQAYVKGKVTGAPEGVVRSSFAFAVFRRCERYGQWKCVAWKVIRGNGIGGAE